MKTLLRTYMKNIIENALAPEDLLAVRRRVVDHLYSAFDTIWRPVIEELLNSNNFGDVDFSDEKRLYNEHGGIRGTIFFTHPKVDVEYRSDFMFRVIINVRPTGGYYTEFRFQMPLISRYDLDEKLLGLNINVRGQIANGVILTMNDIEMGSNVHRLLTPIIRQIFEFEEHEQI